MVYFSKTLYYDQIKFGVILTSSQIQPQNLSGQISISEIMFTCEHEKHLQGQLYDFVTKNISYQGY